MANILQVNEREAILTLAAQGWAIRRIARELKIHRHTVQRYVQQSREGSKCTTISTAGSPPKCTISTAGKIGRKSVCGFHEKLIEQKVTQGLTAQRVYQDLKLEVQFTGSYESVKRFVRRLRKADPARVWRIEVEPGEEAQVDFGVGAPIHSSDGRRRKSWVFRIVLSHSRKGYSEAVFHQDTETFLRCLENAFRHFGGVTQTINLDSLKAAVLRFRWSWWPRQVVADMGYLAAETKRRCRERWRVAIVTHLRSDMKLVAPFVSEREATCEQGQPLEWLGYDVRDDLHWFGPLPPAQLCRSCWQASGCPRQFAYAPAVHETLLGLLPLNTLAAQRLLQQVRPWIEPAQSYEKNQLGLGAMFFNSLRLTWCMALLADAAVLLRVHALLHAPPVERALLRELAPQQGELNFES